MFIEVNNIPQQELLLYATTQMNPQNTVLSKSMQTQEYRYHSISIKRQNSSMVKEGRRANTCGENG